MMKVSNALKMFLQAEKQTKNTINNREMIVIYNENFF